MGRFELCFFYCRCGHSGHDDIRCDRPLLQHHQCIYSLLPVCLHDQSASVDNVWQPLEHPGLHRQNPTHRSAYLYYTPRPAPSEPHSQVSLSLYYTPRPAPSEPHSQVSLSLYYTPRPAPSEPHSQVSLSLYYRPNWPCLVTYSCSGCFVIDPLFLYCVVACSSPVLFVV